MGASRQVWCSLGVTAATHGMLSLGLAAPADGGPQRSSAVSEAVSNEAVSNEAVSNEAVSNEAELGSSQPLNTSAAPSNDSGVTPTALPTADVAERCVNTHALGQEARLDLRLSAARTHFTACATASCPALVRADCETWLSEVEAEAPKVVFELSRHLSPQEVTVWVNGQATNVPYGRPITYDPGTLALRVEAPGREPLIRSLTLRAGAPPTTFPIELSPLAPREPTSTSDIPAPEQRPVRSADILPYALGGVSVVGAAVGTYFAFSGVEQQRDGLRTCAPLCPSDEVATVRRNLLVADVSFGVSVVSAIAAVVLALSPDSDEDGDEKELASQLSLHAGAESIVLRGSF